MDKPNIIIFQCDQLRAFDVGCYGSTLQNTPNIDHFAKQAFRIDNAVCNNPVCMPSRSSLISGQYSRTVIGDLGNDFLQTSMGIGEFEPEMPESQRGNVFPNKTLPEILQNSGYKNTVIGKWHIRPSPEKLGFHNSILSLNNHRHSGQKYSFNGSEYIEQQGFGPDFEIEQVEHVLENQNNDQPFFLYYNIMPPHMPLADMPKKFIELYESNDVKLRPNVFDENELPYSEKWFNIYLWDYLFYHFQKPDTKILPKNFDLHKLVALYSGAIAWVDSIFGRLLSSITETGLDENTIVLFTSDHGDQLGSHHRWNKGVIFEESVRIPQIWRWPKKIKCGNSSNQVSSTIDVMPSLLDACGINVPAWVQGQSIFKVLNGEINTLRRNLAFIETSSSSRGNHLTEIGIRTSSHILSLCLDKENHDLVEGTDSLYDLKNDPYEQRDLFNLKTHQDLKRQLRNTLTSWHNETPWLEVPNDGANRTKYFDSSGFSLANPQAAQ